MSRIFITGSSAGLGLMVGSLLIEQGHLTQAWLAAGSDPEANVTGEYFYHLRRLTPNEQARDPALQDQLLAVCAGVSGIPLPE